MNINLSERDFDRLCHSSMHWAGVAWEEQEDRFETESPTDEINWDLGFVYFVGDSAASMILGREYIKDQGFDVQVLWDMAEMPNGEWSGYCLVTDYASEVWRRESKTYKEEL
jgi:hypothetical protein